MDFRDFILNENKTYLSQTLGDILSAMQELEQHKSNIGTRQLVGDTERIINQLRKILHGNWSKKELKYLKSVQKAAVALAKAIDEKDSLPEVLGAATGELQDLMARLGEPVNTLGSETEKEDSENTSH